MRRGSTNATPEVSALVRQALEYIRRHACEHGLSIASVAAEMHCSRSLATSRFRKETGRSILDEIHEHRFKRMCELLAQGNLPIAMVVERGESGGKTVAPRVNAVFSRIFGRQEGEQRL